MSISEKLKAIQQQLEGTNTRLIIVTKTHPPETLQEVYAAGGRVFGENRVQELVPKYEALPRDIEWHLIGTLQRNKVKYIAPFVAMIHSVDSWDLLREIDKQAAKCNRVIDCLLQLHIAQEDTKHGLSETEAEAILAQPDLASLRHVRIVGVMGMASFTDDETQVRGEFRRLKDFFERIKTKPLPHNVSLKEISMGMSGDYQWAIEEGSTLIRVGSAILGARG